MCQLVARESLREVLRSVVRGDFCPDGRLDRLFAIDNSAKIFAAARRRYRQISSMTEIPIKDRRTRRLRNSVYVGL